ncbi:MAG: hypothetical protein SVE93_03025 [Candidatus Thermoplasmatota archaeon]|nr:hypothetical protein [Candidatus Thermoplasmatota archaeon]
MQIMSLLPFYVYLASTGVAAIIALYAFFRFFLKYREVYTPQLFYLSMFFFFFSINYFVVFLRAILGRNMFFYTVSNLFGPLALVFIMAFAVSLVWSGRERLSFAFSLSMFAIFFGASLYSDSSVIAIYPGVSEVVYPYSFVLLTLLTISSLAFFVFAVFSVYAFRARWSALRRGGMMFASGFLILAIFTYLFDWPGLFAFLLPFTRLMNASGIFLVYLGARTLQSAKVPFF